MDPEELEQIKEEFADIVRRTVRRELRELMPLFLEGYTGKPCPDDHIVSIEPDFQISKSWWENPKKLEEDIGPQPSRRHIIKHIDPDGPLCKGNAYWGLPDSDPEWTLPPLPPSSSGK